MDKNCTAIESLLSAVALGEASPEERETAERHLAGCAACRDEMDLLARTAELVRSSRGATPTLTDGTRAKLLEAAGRPASIARPRRSVAPIVLSWVGGFAAAAAILLAMRWMEDRSGNTGGDLAGDRLVASARAPLAGGGSGSREWLEEGRTAVLQPKLQYATEDSHQTRAQPVPPHEGMDVSAVAAPLDSSRPEPLAPAPMPLERRLEGERLAMQQGASLEADVMAKAARRSVDRADNQAETRPTEAADRKSAPRPAELEKDASPLAAGDASSSSPGVSKGRNGGEAATKELAETLSAAKAQPGSRAEPFAVAAGDGGAAPEPGGSDELRSRGAIVESGRKLAEAPAEMPRLSTSAIDKVDEYKAGTPLRLGLDAKSGAPADGAKPGDAPPGGVSGLPPPSASPRRAVVAATPSATAEAIVTEKEPASAEPARKAGAPAPTGAVANSGESAPPTGDAPAGASVAAPRPAKPVSANSLAAGPATAPDAEPEKRAAPPVTDQAWKERIDEVLSRLDRRPGETPDLMLYRYWGDNPFVDAQGDALSTFAVDVDTASYTLLRKHLIERGVLPPREAIRTEELVNYFRGHYAPPPAGDDRPFAICLEAAPSPFAHDSEYKLMRVGIKGREVSREKRKAVSLVFVIDTSGSMRRENRLELVKDGLRLLVGELDEGDTIGVVAFDREARTILPVTPASRKEEILDAIGSLAPRQNTNVNAGLELGYFLAAQNLLGGGVNRVILCSDGVANTGVTDATTMLERVREQREKGIFLTCVGVGLGNLNDALMEELADKGNGQCLYMDRIEEARRIFVDDLTGTLEVIAKDVKVQVEFDPSKVLRYRLLGYENRAIADADFRNNKVDAGEIGAGHEVTALYEVRLRSGTSGRFATVRVRSLTVDHGEAQEVELGLDTEAVKGAFVEASPRFQLHACVAEFAEVLRESYWARGSSLAAVADRVEALLGLAEKEGGPRLGEDPDVIELVAFLRKADALVRVRESGHEGNVARLIDDIKVNRYERARLEDEAAHGVRTDPQRVEDLTQSERDLRARLETLLRR